MNNLLFFFLVPLAGPLGGKSSPGIGDVIMYENCVIEGCKVKTENYEQLLYSFHVFVPPVYLRVMSK